MTMFEAVLKESVFIDFELDPLFGSDQMDVDYPHRFATVEFKLANTSVLSSLADRIRKDMGFAPMALMDEYTDETCDTDGWYDFYYGINALGAGIGDNCIAFIVVNSDSPDNEETYMIDLSDDERSAMYQRMDEQCREHLGKGCRELLTEADAHMQEEMEA